MNLREWQTWQIFEQLSKGLKALGKEEFLKINLNNAKILAEKMAKSKMNKPPYSFTIEEKTVRCPDLYAKYSRLENWVAFNPYNNENPNPQLSTWDTSRMHAALFQSDVHTVCLLMYAPQLEEYRRLEQLKVDTEAGLIPRDPSKLTMSKPEQDLLLIRLEQETQLTSNQNIHSHLILALLNNIKQAPELLNASLSRDVILSQEWSDKNWLDFCVLSEDSKSERVYIRDLARLFFEMAELEDSLEEDHIEIGALEYITNSRVLLLKTLLIMVTRYIIPTKDFLTFTSDDVENLKLLVN